MAMFPALMHDSFSDFFDDPFFSGWRNSASHVGAPVAANLMKTDVRESEKGYDVAIDMPGFNKDDIALELHDGYLTVSAKRDEHRDEKDEGGRWVRRERYAGSCSRSFYVGDDVKDSDVSATYKDGTLHIDVAKVQPAPKVENRHQIAIED
ncbi:Molecular chaperone IbpA, HSP20 family [Bifidobacterium bohemicum]|uniref:Hsp20-family heat shock chaperone n=1 Tax=Bifidobacterium bohemicum DSM 22767 TaxID=1437606 RepID=A0A086ZK07_9BIFI|nr:Hsp20/alpha crystallin family protein [Bifidobacterium bohemicum]KFI46857.1 Hsp20-family heat shock chaperone [Bifidobacterium bohemicum DSM 22767]SCB83208.1 Molecular chaperone IbpA, HSP20 family [Bifidobacterium bohemicum]